MQRGEAGTNSNKSVKQLSVPLIAPLKIELTQHISSHSGSRATGTPTQLRSFSIIYEQIQSVGGPEKGGLVV